MGQKPKIKSANLESSKKQSWRDLTFFIIALFFPFLAFYEISFHAHDVSI